MQEWLTVIIVLLIVAVVLDGLRRMRHSRRSVLRMSRNINQHPTTAVDESSDYGSELPSGGARVVNVRKAEDAVERNVEIRQKAEYKRRNALKSFRIPEQVSLNLDQQVPTLMESIADQKVKQQSSSPIKSQELDEFNEDGRIEPVFSHNEDDELETGFSRVDDVDNEYDTLDEHGHDLPHDLPNNDELDEWDRAAFSDGSDEVTATSSLVRREIDLPPPDTVLTAKEGGTASRHSEPPAATHYEYDDEEAFEDDYREPELVLVINVMAQKGEQFDGAELLDIILSQGLRFGAMNIFHRHEEEEGDGEILYSMANIVMPGTFDLAKIKTFSTPGISLFMTLPMDANSIEAFEDMLTTAKIIAARLQGELKDENRSVLTPQTITHYRSKLQEFARQQLSKAPA